MIPLISPDIGAKEIKAALSVLRSGQYAQGPKVAEFEKDFAKFCNAKYAIATSNGTTALQAALYAHGIGNGDEVITTPFTFIATANSILSVGAKPVFADIKDDSTIDPKKIEKAFIALKERLEKLETKLK